jgi:hypothetical protein
MSRRGPRRRYGRAWRLWAGGLSLLYMPLALLWYWLTGAEVSLQMRTFRIELWDHSKGNTGRGSGLIIGMAAGTRVRQPTLLRPRASPINQDIEGWFGEPARVEGKWIDFGNAGYLVTTRVYAGGRLLQNNVEGRIFTPWRAHLNEHAHFDGSIEARLHGISVEVSRCVPPPNPVP